MGPPVREFSAFRAQSRLTRSLDYRKFQLPVRTRPTDCTKNGTEAPQSTRPAWYGITVRPERCLAPRCVVPQVGMRYDAPSLAVLAPARALLSSCSYRPLSRRRLVIEMPGA